MKKQWKRLAALSSAAVMAVGTLLYFPTDTLQNISWGITASAEDAGAKTWNEGNLTWTLDAEGTMTISGSGEMKSYRIPDSPATQKKDSVNKVVIQEGVTSIGEYAFNGCSSLTSIEIPESVTSIGNDAFSGCTGLTSIEIPDSVTSIKWDMFSGCSSLTSIVIPNNVTSIGSSAFSGCSSLASITIPSSVTSIGEGAFSGTAWLTNKQQGNPLVIVNGILIDGTTCSGEVTIPNDVTSIAASAFQKCTNLTSIVIPEGITSIRYSAFENCSNLANIEIPSSVTSIGNNAFNGCTALTEVLLKGNSTLTYNDLGVDTSKVIIRLNEDDGLTWTLNTDGTMTISGTGPMKSYDDRLEGRPYNSPVFNNSEIKKVVIEDGVTSIGDFAFMWSGLTSITIPESVTSIGNGAFFAC